MTEPAYSAVEQRVQLSVVVSLIQGRGFWAEFLTHIVKRRIISFRVVTQTLRISLRFRDGTAVAEEWSA